LLLSGARIPPFRAQLIARQRLEIEMEAPQATGPIPPIACRESGDRLNWSRGGSAAWLVSLCLHSAALLALGLAAPPAPEGAADGAAREAGIVLVARSAEKAEY